MCPLLMVIMNTLVLILLIFLELTEYKLVIQL